MKRYVVLALALAGCDHAPKCQEFDAGVMACATATIVRWEYKTIAVEAPFDQYITLDEGRLDALGMEGWELVSTWVEPESSVLGFSDVEYTTGVAPRVRPVRATLLFKRPVW
jgi:hypothetical protein